MRGLQYLILIVFGFLGALGLLGAVMKNQYGGGSDRGVTITKAGNYDGSP